MPSAATLLIVALCTHAKDVVSSATSGGSGSGSGSGTSNRNTKGRAQLVSISAPWPTSPLSPLAEASEFAAEGGSSLFWDYVEALGDAPQLVFRQPPYTCSSCGDSSGDGAAVAGEGNSRHGSPREPAATGADASQSQHSDEEMETAAARLAVEAAVTAAGHGFGSGADAAATGDGGTPGVGLDTLSLRLLEVALSARCVSFLE